MNCDVTNFKFWTPFFQSKISVIFWQFDCFEVQNQGFNLENVQKRITYFNPYRFQKVSNWNKMPKKRFYAPDRYDRPVDPTRERWDESYKRSKQNLSTMSSSSPTIIIFFVSISYQGVARMLHYSISVWQIVLRQFLVPLWFSIVSWTIKW